MFKHCSGLFGLFAQCTEREHTSEMQINLLKYILPALLFKTPFPCAKGKA